MAGENKASNWVTIIIAIVGSLTTIIVTLINTNQKNDIDTTAKSVKKQYEMITEKLEGVPVGTIISSYLTFDQLNRLTHNNEATGTGAWSTKSKWAPADGRSSTGSIFFELTQQPNVPDIRGVFLRGLNQFDPDQLTVVDPRKKDPEARTRGSFQDDSFESHSHPARGHITGNITGSNGTSDCDEGNQKKNSDPGFPDRNVSVTVDATGGNETRPKNVAIYYYIRIN